MKTLLSAVREEDTTFATSRQAYEKNESPIDEVDLTPVMAQLSAVLHSRLVGLTTKEAFAIVDSTQGKGIEAWRQLSRRFDLQIDARLASLIMNIIGYKIGKTQDIQASLVSWEAALLSLHRDQKEEFSPRIRRALLLSIMSHAVQTKMLEHLDMLTTYQHVRDKIVSLVQVSQSPDAMDCSGCDPEQPWTAPGGDEELWLTAEEEERDIAALADVKCNRCGGKRPLRQELRRAGT